MTRFSKVFRLSIKKWNVIKKTHLRLRFCTHKPCERAFLWIQNVICFCLKRKGPPEKTHWPFVPFFLTTPSPHAHSILNLQHQISLFFAFLALSFLLSSLINVLVSTQIQITFFWMAFAPKTSYFTGTNTVKIDGPLRRTYMNLG